MEKLVPITRLGKFFGAEDYNLDIGMGEEWLEGDMNFTVILYRIDRYKTKTDAVYGEVLEDVIFNNGTMQIDMGEKSKKVTIREHEEKVVKDEQLRVNRAFERKKIEGQMLINKLD